MKPKLIHLILAAAAAVLPSQGSLFAEIGFADDFSGAAIDPAWQIMTSRAPNYGTNDVNAVYSVSNGQLVVEQVVPTYFSNHTADLILRRSFEGDGVDNFEGRFD